MTDDIKWQPIMLILNRRLECVCGALAIFVTGDLVEGSISMEHVQAWCQMCFMKAQEEGENDTAAE
jgi:hypothetical protein